MDEIHVIYRMDMSLRSWGSSSGRSSEGYEVPGLHPILLRQAGQHPSMRRTCEGHEDLLTCYVLPVLVFAIISRQTQAVSHNFTQLDIDGRTLNSMMPALQVQAVPIAGFPGLSQEAADVVVRQHWMSFDVELTSINGVTIVFCCRARKLLKDYVCFLTGANKDINKFQRQLQRGDNNNIVRPKTSRFE